MSLRSCFIRIIFFAIALLSPAFADATTVKMQTSLGPIEIDLFDSATPRTVANFMSYVNRGAYKESFIHRSVPGFVIHGGGYAWDMPANAITRQVFATGTAPPAVDYTDLWGNPNESGWGVTLTQQFGILFAAWFVYDTTGKPIWYAATNCAVTATGCAGELYRVDSGVPLTKAWNGAKPVATKVGDVTFTFGNAVTA